MVAKQGAYVYSTISTGEFSMFTEFFNIVYFFLDI